jgi:hypothetical protein
MSKGFQRKTDRKATTENKTKRLKEPGGIGKRASQASRRIKDVEVAKESDPEMIVYSRAIVLFNTGQFQAAKEAFTELAGARNRDLAHSAELRIRMCDRRISPDRFSENPEVQ